jgi:hypothetical protein
MPMPHGGGVPVSFTYRDLEIVAHDPGPQADPMLTIGGQDVMVRREETGGYSAPMHNMFASYPTVQALARELVDISPVFIARRYGQNGDASSAKPKRTRKGK